MAHTVSVELAVVGNCLIVSKDVAMAGIQVPVMSLVVNFKVTTPAVASAADGV